METGVDLERELAAAGAQLRRGVAVVPRSALRDARGLAEALDGLGQLSAEAQGLARPITSADRVRAGRDDVFVLVEGRVAVGMLRAGRRRLFLHDENAQLRQVDALCVLDFFVHPHCQRRGQGRRLFERFMEHHAVASAAAVAYDRPSAKSLAFLAKHHGLHDAAPQSNNFTIFPGFFSHQATHS